MRRPLADAVGIAVLSSLALSVSRAELPNEQFPTPIPYTPITKQKLIVGVNADPPFNIRETDGSWTGISVDLWRAVAKGLGLTYEFREINLKGRFDGLIQGWLDVAVGPLTITARREETSDFTHGYYSTNVAVAVPSSSASGVNNFFFDLGFLKFLWAVFKVSLGLLAVMALVAVLIWLSERRANAAHFGGSGNPVRGLGSALWWSAVTMASVGYGDLIPRTLLGRTIAIIWMFASLVLVSTFIATMASTLTAERLGGIVSIQRLDDLRRFQIGAVANTTGAAFLKANRIRFKSFSFDELFEGIKQNKVQAVIYDEPILRYAIHTRYPGQFKVLPLKLATELYGFALPEGSSLREPVNRVLLQEIHDPAWHDLIVQYLGDED